MNYINGQHNYSGVGVNPMYGTAGQSTDNGTDTYVPLSPPSSLNQPSEYDEINNGHSKHSSSSVLYQSAPPLPIERRVTSNSLYASHNAALLRHPTLSPYELTRSCDMILEEDEFDKDETRCKCLCSPDLALVVGSLLVIILSVMAIILSLLLQFGITTSSSNNPSVTTITLNTNSTTATVDGSNNNNNMSSNDTQTAECDCSQFSVSTMQLLKSNFTDIGNSILRIMEEIERLRTNENISVSEKEQLLSGYLTQIKSINDSLQQLIPQANQPRHPILTGLNHTANITVNYDDCTDFRHTCSIGGYAFQAPGACQTTAVDYASETHIVIATFGSVTSSEPLTDATAATMQLHPHAGERFFSNDTILERLKKGDIYYLCTNFNPFSVNCNVYFKRCSYQTNLNVTASISFHHST